MEKVYMIKIDDCYDYESHQEIELYKNKGDALNRFNDIAIQIKSENDISKYDEVVDEEGLLSFYDEGWYNKDHYELSLEEVEVK